MLLTVNSKNEEENALSGLRRPDSVLKPEDFLIIKANWESKDRNIKEIAEELNIGTDALVFVDDNPAERHIVRSQVPDAAVPEIGEPQDFLTTLDRSGFFEVTALSEDDLKRGEMYKANFQRTRQQAAFADYRKIYQSLLKKYKKASFYFMDVLPMKDLNCRRNRRAVRFNELLKKAFPRQYIGGYEYLLEDGYTNSYDGVHYNVDTSRKIFDYILSKIDSRRENGQKESGL